MSRHNISGSCRRNKGGKPCVNSIHPEIGSLGDTCQSENHHPFPEGRHSTDYNDLFSSNIIRCTKSFMLNVRDDRIIHIQHYVPTSCNVSDQNKSRSDKEQDSPVVLFFIHGVGGSWKVWNSQIQYFVQEGYEIIAFDLLGHGLSSRPDGYTPYEFSELAVDVLFVFDKFCKRRNVLIGHSYGTSFCALLSNERGCLISKMVLISGGGPTSLMPDRCSAFCLPLPVFFLILPVLLKVFRRMAFHVNTKKLIQDKITTFGVSAHVLKAIMQGQRWEESDEQYHSDLTVPALLIYGSGDKFVALADEIWMNETIYSSKLEVIKDAGHMVMIESPQEVNRLIQEFLNRDANTRMNKQNICDKQTSNQQFNDMSSSHVSFKVTRGTDVVNDDSIQTTPSKRSSSRLSRTSANKCRGKKMF